jgi:arsenate reductase
MPERKKTILVLCTGNSCRSQMAEGFLREYAGNSFDIYSAGFEPKDEIHPYAKQVMREIGRDISGQYPNPDKPEPKRFKLDPNSLTS